MQKERIQKITELLKRDYPTVSTPLFHKSAFQLLVATMMSAQTLDETVNKVSPKLFETYPTVFDFAHADAENIESIIKSVNYYKTKAKNIIKLSKKLIEEFDGKVPFTIKELTTLPGIGRKTANVIISEWFSKPLDQRGSPQPVKIILNENDKVIVKPEGFVVDTHVLRTSKRLRLTKETKPDKVEKDLMKIFPREEWNDMSLRLIFHGRYRCKSQNPQCYKDPEWCKICSCIESQNVKKPKRISKT